MMTEQKRYYRLWQDVDGERWWLNEDGESYTGDKSSAGIFSGEDDHWTDWVDYLRKEYLSIDEHMQRWGVASFPWLD